MTIKRYVFTAAQNNTKVHEGLWASLMTLLRFYDASLHVSRFAYNKKGFGADDQKPDGDSLDDTEDNDVWYDPKIAPYVSDERIEIGNDLIWCGELNILPTRVNPISGFESYARNKSVILPHVKMAMQSVPTMKHLPARYAYTTGACTEMNYIQRAAGQKAEFHHVFGALLVEVDENGHWWARQLNFGKYGKESCICDKAHVFYSDNVVDTHAGVTAITHGDIHIAHLNTDVQSVVWGEDGVVANLGPYVQFFHDLVDFSARNHHNIDDPLHLVKQMAKGNSRVEKEYGKAQTLLNLASDYSKCVIITSNHDKAIDLWLRNTTALRDPFNAGLWCSLNARAFAAAERGEDFHAFESLLRDSKWYGDIVREDESYRDVHGIEYGLHGHLGPNGARGNTKNLRTAGRAVTGHTHSAGIVDGVYTVGVYANLDLGYNKGLSSWSHSFCVTYLNGKRSIYTINPAAGYKPWA